ncbi:MAG: ABC transporter ATP-binding protein, partial [Candidatus Marinimicrobia bacterium]|nr:ABC transporter ATP-binding protein [Candidatus Neomarinimicrobiota bacterium]
FLKEKAKSGVTIFLSTHSLHVAEELCDRIGILNNGKLIAEGTLDELRIDAKSDGESLESLFLNLIAEEELNK